MSRKALAGAAKERLARDSHRDVRDSRLDEIEAIYRLRYPAFLRVATAITGDEERGADAVQDGFAGAVRSRSQFRGGPLEPWLWAAVVNSARTIRRKPVALRLVGDDRTPRAPAQGAAETGELRSAIAALPERQRVVLFLRYFADLDYRTIAEVVGIRTGTVGATLTAARGALNRALTEEETCTK
jgi:RNA polymerase sigma factor (sigma-70 family)